MKKRLLISLFGILSVGTFLVMIIPSNDSATQYMHTNKMGVTHELVVYKSPTCGCCKNWITYMQGKGYKIDIIDVEDVEKVKQEFNVPDEFYSCHTTIVNGGEYFIEGHIPDQSIAKLLSETPHIQGIGMPGMPSGSPGMPGSKVNQFEIMQLDKNNQQSIYEVI